MAEGENLMHGVQTAAEQAMQTGEQAVRAAGPGIGTGLATAAVVGVGAALLEVELIPGILLGVAAMAAPKLIPSLGRGLRPLVRSTVKAGYTVTQRTREWVAEAGEQIGDMVAEVRAASAEGQAEAMHEHGQTAQTHTDGGANAGGASGESGARG